MLRQSAGAAVDMQTFLISDLDPGLDDPSILGASVTIYSSFAEAEPVWRQAVDDCACYVFQTFEWNTVWKDTIGSTEQVCERIVRVAAADGRTLLLLPLGIYDHHHFTSLQFLGGGLTDYNAPVIDRAFAREVTPSSFARLWRIIVGLLPSVDFVCLVRMPKTIEETPNPLLGLPHARRSGTAFAARLPASFPDFAARDEEFFRQNRYKWRRLGKFGAVEVRFASEEAERDAIVRVATAQKSQWLVQCGLPNIFHEPKLHEFYERLTRTRFQSGSIVAASLCVGGRIVATIWGPKFRDRFCFLLTSYDQAWSQYSVGRLLMESAVQWCIGQRDVKVFDLTVGSESYKQHWSDHALELYEHLHGRTLKGAVVASYRRGRTRLAANGHVRHFVKNIRRARASMAGKER